jgi:hypothetical protein
MSFIEGARESEFRETGEMPIFYSAIGQSLDSVYIQVSVETYITPKFQEWLTCTVMPRITNKCDAIRLAIKNTRGN